jgi:hypothetical protein
MQVVSNTFILAEERQGKANVSLLGNINLLNIL